MGTQARDDCFLGIVDRHRKVQVGGFIGVRRIGQTPCLRDTKVHGFQQPSRQEIPQQPRLDQCCRHGTCSQSPMAHQVIRPQLQRNDQQRITQHHPVGNLECRAPVAVIAEMSGDKVPAAGCQCPNRVHDLRIVSQMVAHPARPWLRYGSLTSSARLRSPAAPGWHPRPRSSPLGRAVGVVMTEVSGRRGISFCPAPKRLQFWKQSPWQRLLHSGSPEFRPHVCRVFPVGWM